MNRLSVARLEELLERARSVRVLVIGDLMLDVYLRGAASRISPEAPVPVVRITEEWRALGGAGNVAANAVALRARCCVIGGVGTDGAGRELRQELLEAEIDEQGLVEIPTRPTTVKTRIMARHQQVARFDVEVETDVDRNAASELVGAVERPAPQADAIVLQDYNKGVLVDPSLRRRPALPERAIRQSWSIRSSAPFRVPRRNRLQAQPGRASAVLREDIHPDESEWLARVRAQLECENLLVTMGEDGMALSTSTGEYLRVPAVARSVYDVSGAGDTVIAAIAVGLAAGATPAEAAIMANHAAALEVAKAGVATVSPDELRATVREHHERAISVAARS
jgi:D-beta-D-heptose 7-phosphate kinase/D-beta-D-heptose 1-phosphate adenosyltransferase